MKRLLIIISIVIFSFQSFFVPALAEEKAATTEPIIIDGSKETLGSSYGDSFNVDDKTTYVYDNIFKAYDPNAEGSSNAVEDSENIEDENLNMLYALGAIDDSFNLTDITRAGYVAMLVRALDLKADFQRDPVYIDVPESHWAFEYINTAYIYGLIAGNAGFFNPDAPITMTDAKVISVRLMGKEPEALARGGYPSGYEYVATTYKISKGIFSQKTETSGAAALLALLCNTLKSKEFTTFAGFDGENLVYVNTENETPLSYYRSVHSIKGVIGAVGPANIYSEKVYEENIVVVENEELFATYEGYINYLGKKVEAFYLDDNGTKKLLYADDEAFSNDVLTIDASDIIGYDTWKYTYSIENKKKYASVSEDASFMYNRRLTDVAVTGLYIPENGGITLIDNNCDRKYDVVLIKNTIDIIVETIVKENFVVYDYYNPEKFVALEDEDSDSIISLISTDGAQLYPAMLPTGSVLTVEKSLDGKIISAVCSMNSVNGKIESVADDDGIKIEVDGKVYKVTKDCTENCSKVLKPGENVILSLNAYNQVADIKAADSANAGMSYAYIIDFAVEGSIGKVARIKLFTDAGEIKIYDFAEKCMVDGNRLKSTEEISDAVSRGRSIGQVALFSLNQNSEIDAFDTAYVDDTVEQEETTLRSIYTKNDPVLWHKKTSNGGHFHEAFWWSTTRTKVFTIYEGETDEQRRYSLSSPFANDKEYAPEAYRNTDSYYADVLVAYSTSQADSVSNKTLYVVERVDYGSTDVMDDAAFLQVNANGTSKRIIMEKDDFEKKDIKAGDIINVDVTPDNYVRGTSIVKVYDYEDREVLTGHDVWFGNSFFIRNGYCYDKKDGFFAVYQANDVSELAEGSFSKIKAQNGLSSAIIYEKVSNGRFAARTATMADLDPYLVVGNSCSHVIIRYEYLQRQQVIIIKE